MAIIKDTNPAEKCFWKKILPEQVINITLTNNNFCKCKKKKQKKIIARLTRISIKPKRKEIEMDPIIVDMQATDEVEQTLQYGAANGAPKQVENVHFEDLPDGVSAVVKEVRTYTDENFPGKTGTEVDIVTSVANDTPDGDVAVRLEADPKLGEPEGELNYNFVMRIGSEATTVRQSRIVVRPKTLATN